jgi:hypothetical protein
VLFVGSYDQALEAWKRLEASRVFTTGQTLGDIASILGKPGLMTSDAICYKTGCGPLFFEFRKEKISKVLLVTWPPRWRGTDGELAKAWEKQAASPRWWEW